MRVSRYADGTTSHVELRVGGRMGKLLAGDLSVEDLDNEELARGQCKDKNGRFSGRPPKAVPRELHDKMVSELLRRGNQLFQEAYLDAIETMQNIALDPDVEPKDRLKAAQYIIERLAGKVPDRVEIRAADPWQQIIDDIIVHEPDLEQVVKKSRGRDKNTARAAVTGGDD